MAQWNKSTQDYLNQERTLHEVYIQADQWGKTLSPSESEKSAFGETIVMETSPVFQLDGLYGIDDKNDFVKNSSGTGSQSVDVNGLMTVSSGIGSGSFATLRSNRSVRYRPGQGSLARYTAMWPDGFVAGYQQVAGFINQSDVLAVGYNYGDAAVGIGTSSEFGIVRRTNSKGQVWELDVNTAASGNENLTIYLNNVGFTTTVTSGTIRHNAAEIGSAVGIFTGWIVDYCDDKVWFLYNGPPVGLAGSFAVTNNTGGGTFVAAGSTLQTGSSPVDNWIHQSQFNIDKLDGTGPSRMTLDTSKLNVFQTQFEWLGAGQLSFAIEDIATGKLVPFHSIYYAGINTVPSLSNPSMRIGYAAVNAAPAVGTGVSVSVKGASMLGAIQGKIRHNVLPRAVIGAKSTNTTSSTKQHMLTLKNNRINTDGVVNIVNQRELILDALTAGAFMTTGKGLVLVELYKNAQTTAVREYQIITPAITYSTTDTTLSSSNTGQLIANFVISSDNTILEKLEEYRIILAPHETVSVIINPLTDTVNSIEVGLTFTTE